MAEKGAARDGRTCTFGKHWLRAVHAAVHKLLFSYRDKKIIAALVKLNFAAFVRSQRTVKKLSGYHGGIGLLF